MLTVELQHPLKAVRLRHARSNQRGVYCVEHRRREWCRLVLVNGQRDERHGVLLLVVDNRNVKLAQCICETNCSNIRHSHCSLIMIVPNLDIDLLRSFTAVADTRSFTAAGEL